MARDTAGASVVGVGWRPARRQVAILSAGIGVALASAPIGIGQAWAQAGSAGGETLPEVSVAGTAERANGPVAGYRATRTGTATRTDSALRDVPQSIQVVPRDVLADQADIRLTDAVTNVSNVQPAGTIQGRSDTYVLRGFRTQTYAIDGLLLNQAITFLPTQRDLANAERVEVLKGPASVLYGRGDPGGLINIVTRQPAFMTAGDLTAQGGSFGFKRLQGSVTGPLAGTETLAGRLSFGVQGEETFRRFGGPQNSRQFVAPAFLFNPDPTTRISVNAEFTQQYNQYDEGLSALGTFVPVRTIGRYYGEPWARYFGESSSVTIRGEHDVSDALTIRQVLNVQWGAFELLSPRATAVNAAGTTVSRRLSATRSVNDSLTSQTEAVLRFDGGGFRHTALVGFEYVDGYRHSFATEGTAGSVSFLNPIGGAVPAVRTLAFQNDIKQKVGLYGTYVQDQIDLGRGLQLVAGARFDVADQYYASRTSPTAPFPPAQSISGASPRIGLVYRPVEPLTVYGSFTTSFSPQIANVLNVVSPKPETGQQIEAGIRYDIVPDRLTASGAVFKITRANVAASDPVRTGFSIITGEQVSHGFEGDIAGEILPGWKVIGGFGYIDATVTKDTTVAIGNRLPAVPRTSASLWSTYQFQDGPLRGWGFGGGLTHVGDRTGDIANSYKVGSYTRLDATLFYEVDPSWRFAVNGRNLTNAHYVEQPFNRFNNVPGAPATILASVTARY